MRGLSVALVCAAACAHAPDLALRPDPAPPSGSTTEVFVARDGTQLLARTWPASGASRGVIVIVHGLKDHSARYAALATRLAGAGYAVYALDLRGHGRSAGPRVAPARWTDYVDDVDRFTTAVEQRAPGKPVYLFGHSMGGAIATRVAELHRPELAGLLLSGPALAIDAPPLLIAATRLTAVLAPNAPALDLDNRDFSSDPEAAAAIGRDELVSQPAAPARTAGGLVDGIASIWAHVDRLTMPLLAMHGTADRLTAPAGSRLLIERAPARDKTLRIYDGYFHDLLHEPGERGRRVEADVVGWLDAHHGGMAVPPSELYRGPLGGDPAGWTQAVELAGGASRADDGATHFAGRVAIDLARPRRVGWHGALTARLIDARWALAVRPLGIAVHGGGAALGVSFGAALTSGTVLAASGAAWFEHALGPLHLGLFGELARRSSTTELVGATLRLGRDHRYWPHARAGVGPAVSLGADCAGRTCGSFVMLGLQLLGAN